MNKSCVLDASAAAAVLFREPEALNVMPYLLKCTQIEVPSLLFLELVNVGRNKVRRGEMQASLALDLLKEVQRWPLRSHEVAWPVVWQVAEADQLTAYDAAYLALARQLRLPLLTLDRQLLGALRPDDLPRS